MPVPSESPRDLKFNAGKIDEFVTSLQREYEDRFGKKHYTIEGLRWVAQNAISAFGYITLKSFQLGAPLPNNELTLPNQVLQDDTDGEYYRWDGSFPKQVLPGSTPEPKGEGAWLSVGDSSLRANLGSHNPPGASLIGLPYGTVNDAIKYLTPYMFGASDAIDADNTVALSKMLDDAQDGTVLDFCGQMFRVYANVSGIPSATANPTTDNALPYSQILKIDGKKNITFKNGGIYAANQSVTSTEMYYPSTLSLIKSKNISFDNFTLESKGEKWGDSDASANESFDRRLEFCATNGGHSLFIGRCSNIRVRNGIFRLCGSVSTVYASSSDDLVIDNSFFNTASLGYSAFCSDNWVGDSTVVNLSKLSTQIVNATCHAETLARREDGAAIGSSVYCGKAGVVAEGKLVHVNITGGNIADMFANGAAKWLGAAFYATSGAVVHSVGSSIRNCAAVGGLHFNDAEPARLQIEDVDAETGLTGIIISPTSFGKVMPK